MKYSNPRAIMNWSGGKDAALSLFEILKKQEYDIACLLTSISKQYNRISMHGVRVDLLHLQAESIGLPLVKIYIPEDVTMDSYERLMRKTLSNLIKEGASISIFGDIFLDNLRKYREMKLATLDLKGVFPLWKRSTKSLISQFIDQGFKAITTCVNEQYLNKSFVGRVIDKDFIRDLPNNVDPCGENGEFHTFVYDAPFFKRPIFFDKGQIVYRKYSSNKSIQVTVCSPKEISESSINKFGFWYCDLIPQPQKVSDNSSQIPER